MSILVRCIRSDFKKFRHTSMLWLHIVLPVTAAFVFIAYYSVSPWNTDAKISGYCEVIGIALPVIIALVSSKAIDQEGQAGNFQVMLCGINSRAAMYASKLIAMLLLGMLAVALGIGVFAVGFQSAPAFLYLQAAGLLLGGSVFLYILHLFIGLRFGKGACVGLGIMEALIAALSLTGLGDGKWYFLPCAWSARLCSTAIFMGLYPTTTGIGFEELKRCLIIAVPTTISAFILSLLWFQNWEGRDFYE